MTTRYVLIRYRDSANVARVGSGYIVRGSTVLTANHVADGTGHRVECDRAVLDVDPSKTVLSGTNDVDLGVLQLTGNPLQLGQTPFARVGRDAMIISDCMAVGFPRWTADEEYRQYLTKQVEGFIRTADRVGMNHQGGADGQLLRLTISWRTGDQQVPVPAGLLDGEPASPWGGMSGAVVTASDDSVIGVIHSHNYARDRDVLTVTPLLALAQLDGVKQRQFCDALGILDLDLLPMVNVNGRKPAAPPGGAAVDQPGRPSDPRTPVFSDEVRRDWQERLASLNLQIPSPWDYVTLERFYRDCDQRAGLPGADPGLRTACDLAKGLWLAAAALPLLRRFGGQDIGIRKLQYLYDRHVQSPPECATLDGMLIDAAGVGIRERYLAVNGPGRPGDEVVTALARFMLGIASHWKAGQKRAAAVDVTEIQNWIKEHLDVNASDTERYLETIRRRFWALIEFETLDLGTKIWGSADREMPTAIIARTVSDAGKVKMKRFPCEPAPVSEGDVEELLRDRVIPWLPDGDFIVDLLLPRDWLDARVEHWSLLNVAGSLESLSKTHAPHLRWVKHRCDRELASRLERRFGGIRWMDDPENIPLNVTSDQALLRAWLDAGNQPGMEDPPYFIGSQHGARNHDPLADLLLEGYGFIVWFTADTPLPIPAASVCVAGVSELPWQRKDDLPRQLAVNARQHKPIIIWSEPGKREDFYLAPMKSRGPRRSVRK